MCVSAQSGIIDDQSLADYAYALARGGRYQEALATLDLMRNPNTAEALNYRGYATRKLGRVDEGIAFYKQAVALDPNYTLVREYLGEAYVTQRKLDLAKAELAEIEKRCGTTCEPYEDLAEAIERDRGLTGVARGLARNQKRSRTKPLSRHTPLRVRILPDLHHAPC